MGLFDKLASLEAKKEEEVPEGADEPLVDRLKKIGDQQAVNPPEPVLMDFPLLGTSCSICGKPQYDTPSGSLCENGHGGVAPAPAPAPATETSAGEVEGSTCPFCKKVFRHLSRHKCAQAPATPTAPAAGGFILILDALFERGVAWPLWGAVVLFTDIIAPLADAVAKENKQEHWGAVEFGRGGSLLAAKLEKWLATTNPQGVILADSSTPELRAVKEVLKKYAKAIIQGVR